MPSQIGRRHFLKSSLVGTATAGMTFRFEERALAAARAQPTPPADAVPPATPQPMPKGKIGKLEISRLICGGNLTSGHAHSRDLIYVSPLLKHYFTDDKVFETWRLCEQNGINTCILRLDEQVLRLIQEYWYGQGGKVNWICQCTLPKNDWKSDILRAVDGGAHAAYVHGGVADQYVKAGRMDELGQAMELIRKNGIPAGIAGHMVEVPIAVQKHGMPVDFFMKTFNAKKYWSAGPMPRHDSVFEETPEQTRDFMLESKIPWIAYKVLGAGAIHPREGFRYALENGADFLCVGMFDFQVAEDASVARDILASALKRARPWCA